MCHEAGTGKPMKDVLLEKFVKTVVVIISDMQVFIAHLTGKCANGQKHYFF